MIFGIRFEPGSDARHLCKPTSIAVATTGEIFVADGYCNSRILKYNAAGGLLRVIPSPPGKKFKKNNFITYLQLFET